MCVVCKGFLSRTSFMLGIESWALASVWPGRDGPAPVSSHTRLPQQPWAMQWLCHGNYSIAAVCRNTSTKEHTHAGLTCCLTRNHKGWHDSERSFGPKDVCTMTETDETSKTHRANFLLLVIKYFCSLVSYTTSY